MFDSIREGKAARWITVGIFRLLILSFALWGVETYVRGIGKAEDLGSVAGSSVSQQEFSEAMQARLDQMRAQAGYGLDPGIAERPEFRRAVFETIVNQRLLVAEAGGTGVTVGDKLLAQRITAITEFQGEDGNFSKARYDAFLRQRGYTAPGFESRLRRDLVLQTVSEGISETPIMASTSVRTLLRAAGQTREVSVARLTTQQFSSQVKIDEAAIKAYYDSHKSDFTVPDQARVEYVVLSTDELAAQMTATGDEVKKLYDERASQFRQPEERRASHILIKVDEKAGDAERKAARDKAENLLRQAREHSESFAQLAQKNSQDPGSAQQGGDLGFFARGMMVKAFEEPVYQMAKDEIRGPVESEFGFHIIKLTDLRPERVKPLDEVQGQLASEIKRQKAQKRFSEIAEGFSNLVYEQSGSLKPAVESLKLEVRQSPWLTRDSAPVKELANPKLLQAIFTEDVLKNKRNTEAIETSPGTLVAARLLEFKPSLVKPVSDVTREI